MDSGRIGHNTGEDNVNPFQLTRDFSMPNGSSFPDGVKELHNRAHEMVDICSVHGPDRQSRHCVALNETFGLG